MACAKASPSLFCSASANQMISPSRFCARNFSSVGRWMRRSAAKGCGAKARNLVAALSPSERVRSVGASAVPMRATGRPSRAACLKLASALARRVAKSGPVAQPLSKTTKSGPRPAVSLAPRVQSGPAIAKITSAAMIRRKINSQGGVRRGVSRSGIKSLMSGSGGKAIARGRGGVTRSSSQRTGRATRPARTRGAEKTRGRELNIFNASRLGRWVQRRVAIRPARLQRLSCQCDEYQSSNRASRRPHAKRDHARPCVRGSGP